MIVPIDSLLVAVILWRFFAGLLPLAMVTIALWIIIIGWTIVIDHRDVSEATTSFGGWLIYIAFLSDVGRIFLALGNDVLRRVRGLFRRRAERGRRVNFVEL
jgi:hypothetical protein